MFDDRCTWRKILLGLLVIFWFALLVSSVKVFAVETCKASWYGAESGARTADGRKFRPMGLTIALRSRDFGGRFRVSYRGRSVIVRHNDFGPAMKSRCADLSHGAARALGMEGAGVATVQIERVN
jgi:rare lipoprotein A